MLDLIGIRSAKEKNEEVKAMKNNRSKRKVPTRFGKQARFSLPVVPAANFRATEPNEFEELKDRLLREQLVAETRSEFLTLLRRAANDAAAVAWAAPYPLLVLPELFREKVATARSYGVKQASLRRDNPPKSGMENETGVAA